MKTDLLDRVRRTVRRFALAAPETRVVAALSGGPDSVALVQLLQQLDAAGELRLAAIAHFNHQLRPAAEADEHFCRDVAASIGRPFLADREDVAARARREQRSIEDAARTARHGFLERARLHFDAASVALGHTKDDQAETFLLRLLRGAGTRGLASMHPRRGVCIRPLLDCRRADLRAYLESRHLAWVHDETNDDVSIPRNRIRAELLPFLERFNPAIIDVLADEAEITRETWHWMDAAAATLFRQICRRDGADRWCLDAEAVGRAPLALARLVVHQAMTRAAHGRSISFAHVENVLQMNRAQGGPIDGPGQRVERLGREVVLTSRPPGYVGRWAPGGANAANPANEAASFFRYPLSIPGEVARPEAGWAVSAEEAGSLGAHGDALLGNGPVAVIQRNRVRGPLSVRNRRPGDRFQPLGLHGSKKLQDFFVDRKVARQQREGLPLVVDDQDRIVWVAGYTLDEAFRVTGPAEGVVILRLNVLGGPA